MAPASVPLYFVVRYGQSGTGSTQMRSADLLRIIAPHLSPRLLPSIVTMPGPRFPAVQRLWARTRPKGGLYFLTKSALSIDAEAADILRARSHGLAFDYIDTPLTDALSRKADVHVCASYAQEDRIKSLQAQGQFAPGPTKVILHNPSQLLYGVPPARRDRFATVYFGTPSVTRIPAALADRIALRDTRDHAHFLAALRDLADFPLHYCFRQEREQSDLLVKPFTKGITAAMCHANVLVSRSVPDATRLLGEDYPFLADGSTDADILALFARAKDAFNGPDWATGLDRMAALREEVSGPTLARKVAELADLIAPR